ncbi:MAG: hypothetical protein R2795_07080 [Saprospiraceae bacterium]
MKSNRLDYARLLPLAPHLAWIIFVPLVIFIVTAVSNAANLTDGIDGLATGYRVLLASLWQFLPMYQETVLQLIISIYCIYQEVES